MNYIFKNLRKILILYNNSIILFTYTLVYLLVY